jgi:uncharacterized protein
MHYEGSFEVTAPREKVYDFVTDPRRVTTIFPSVSSVRITDANDFSFKAKVGLSFIKGVMDVRLSLVDNVRPSSTRLRARGKGLNSTVDLDGSFALDDVPSGGTRVKWTAEVKVGGILANVGSRLIASAADKYVKQIVGSLEKKLA